MFERLEVDHVAVIVAFDLGLHLK